MTTNDIRFEVYHVATAISELSWALFLCSDGSDYSEPNSALRTKIAGAYQHLNLFWNGRRSRSDPNTTLTIDDLKCLSRFPTELYEKMAVNRDISTTTIALERNCTEWSEEIGIADVRFATFHLTEAITDLSRALANIAAAPNLLDGDSDIEYAIAHVYQHINWFWNGRHRSNRLNAELTEDEFDEFSKFPLDLFEHMEIPLSFSADW